MKITRKQIALSILAQAPDGATLPGWIDKAASRRTGTKRQKPEETIQRMLVEYLLLQRDLLFWSTPNHFYLNGADQGRIAGYIANQKKLGMRNGVPDLTIIGRDKHGATFICFAEVKAEGGRVSEAQNDFMTRASELGAFTGVVRSLEELKVLLRLANY